MLEVKITQCDADQAKRLADKAQEGQEGCMALLVAFADNPDVRSIKGVVAVPADGAERVLYCSIGDATALLTFTQAEWLSKFLINAEALCPPDQVANMAQLGRAIMAIVDHAPPHPGAMH